MTDTAERLEHVKHAPRSVSQVKEYTDCPYRYYLHRVLKSWERPAAWLPQGLAFHEAAEAYEKSDEPMPLEDMRDVYIASYVKHTNRLLAETPRMDFWMASGCYRGPEDIERRWGKGLKQLERYIAWREKHPEEVIVRQPDGTPMVELAFTISFGEVTVRGFIDQVLEGSKAGEVHARDLKTGKLPGDIFQLATYGVALTLEYGLAVPSADYWMGESGKATKPYLLEGWTPEKIEDIFRDMDDAVKAERFEPDPEPNKCWRCPVRDACEFSA